MVIEVFHGRYIMRQIKVEYAFKGVEKDYVVIVDLPVDATEAEAEYGIQELQKYVRKSWVDRLTGYAEIGDGLSVRLEELRSFKIELVK